MNKICSKCKQDKNVLLFNTRKDRTSGYSSHCKECSKNSRIKNKEKIKLYQQKHRKENIEQYKLKSKEYKLKNKDILSIKNKEYYELNKKEISLKGKDYYELNKEQISLIHDKYYKLNKKHIIKQQDIYILNRRKIDPLYKMSINIRVLIYSAFKNKGIKKNTKTTNILGCTFQEFKEHLEKQFDDNMNWQNQGSYWWLDHIKPVVLATNEKELIELNHYTNFQPLEKIENIIKGSQYPYIKSLKKK